MYVVVFFDLGIFHCFGCVRYVRKTTTRVYCSPASGAGARANDSDDCYCRFVYVVCFVFNSVVDIFGMHTDEWLIIILMALDDYYQLIFGNVMEILMIGSIFRASGIKLTVYFSLTMGVSIMVSLFLLFCNNNTLW